VFETWFGSKDPGRGRSRNARSASHSPSHLWAVPDQQIPPRRVSIVRPANFEDAQALADRFKRQQPVILNLQNADHELSRRMVDFCAGLTYALDGRIQTVADRLFLLTPHNVEVWGQESERLAKQAFFNQL
jgi:cell division inhibitor SepF